MSVIPFRQAVLAQKHAADPKSSVWVGASAGTGKTKVLTDRVLSLLLGGTPAYRLLCLTFTKAAAAEMANRVIDRLGSWTVLDDADLDRQLADLTDAKPGPALRARARRLFGQVLDTPGGLKIQTIHAFCQSLLGRFPVEAGVAPHFQVLDDVTAASLLREVREGLFAEIDTGIWPELAEALAVLTAELGETRFQPVIDSLIADRHRLRRLIHGAGGIEQLIARQADVLRINPAHTVAEIKAAALDDKILPVARLRAAIDPLLRGKVTDIKIGKALEALLTADDRDECFEYYAYALCKAEDDLPRERLGTGDVLKKNPEIGDLLRDESIRMSHVLTHLRAVRIAQSSKALLRLGWEMLERYERAKNRRAYLDYNDLILTTRDLLARDNGVTWVLYKLDSGLDHILVDEAQDTNREQWEVISALVEEFFSGVDDAARTRTLFVVGDAKQSIFSFQRADPDAFAEMRRLFEQRARDAERPWRGVDLTFSFRSVEAVLDAVDAVFAREPARNGVVDDPPLKHTAQRVGAPGLVELWPAAAVPDKTMTEPWSPPITRTDPDQSRNRVAGLVAKQIAQWLASGEILPSKGRAIRPGDILVLVRRRQGFVDELVRALKKSGVPVAGADRMTLTKLLPVQDLMALGRFVLLPEDDLTLACLLKSPLIGLDEDQLFRLAWQRSGSLWHALGQAAGDDPAFAAAHRRLSGWLARADYMRPYEFFAAILSGDGGRAALLARLGEEAADPLDEFLAQALGYEQQDVPSLQGFLHWLDSGTITVKRESAAAGRDEVRIMTVHGAKGLQAPIVIMPDTMDMPQPKKNALLWHPEAGPLWSSGKKSDDPLCNELRQAITEAERREYRRLLYVAMTRAEDRLYVVGWQTQKNGKAECWYDLIQRGLEGTDRSVAFDFGPLGFEGWAGEGLRITSGEGQGLVPPEEAGLTPAAPLMSVPDWARRAPPPEPTPPRPLAPSAEGDEPPARSPFAPDGSAFFLRGRLIHRLLQSLPTLPRASWTTVAARFLDTRQNDLTPEMIDALIRETLGVLDDPRFAAVFAPGSRAEVPVIGRVGSAVISGQIDRLAVTDAEVLIIDFKTNRPPPRVVDEVAEVYLRQLAAYRALVRQIYPAKPVRAALLWTDIPLLMDVPGPLLDRHLPSGAESADQTP